MSRPLAGDWSMIEKFAVDTPLRWHRTNPECRLCLRGGRFTRVNMFFTGIVAILATAILLGGLLILPEPWARYADIIMHRGPTQYATVFLALWCLLLLLIKLDFCLFFLAYGTGRGNLPTMDVARVSAPIAPPRLPFV